MFLRGGIFLSVAFTLFGWCLTPRLEAQCGWEQIQKLAASDGDASDEFGYAVTIGGDVLLVGASRDEEGA